MTNEISPFQIAEAEGRHAAKTMLSPDANPYAESSPALSIMWTAGFNDELLKLRMELKYMREYAANQHKQITALKSTIAALETELAETTEELMELEA